MQTRHSPWLILCCALSLLLAAAALLRSTDLTATRTAQAAARDASLLLDASNATYSYARLVFTTGGSGTTVWLNTPTNAVTASITKETPDALARISNAIMATSPGVQLPSGVPIDDMLIVQWMGLAQWELVQVTQNQVDIGVTTSFFFRKKI